MSKTKIVEAFEQIVSDCSGSGGYNPGSPNLIIPALNSKLYNAKQAEDAANVAKSILAQATNDREVEFDALPKLASSIIYTLQASGASEQTLNDARFFLRQLTGRKRKSSKPAPIAKSTTAGEPGGEQDKVSHSPQTSYASRAAHFANLVKLISAVPGYTPNESALGLAGLNEKLTRILQSNSSVIQARSNWSSKKMARDKMLYGNDSLVTSGRSVQKYVRAAFGFKSAEFTRISKLKFTKTRP